MRVQILCRSSMVMPCVSNECHVEQNAKRHEKQEFAPFFFFFFFYDVENWLSFDKCSMIELNRKQQKHQSIERHSSSFLALSLFPSIISNASLSIKNNISNPKFCANKRNLLYRKRISVCVIIVVNNQTQNKSHPP